jgi:ketosteroid isomerase-like protein
VPERSAARAGCAGKKIFGVHARVGMWCVRSSSFVTTSCLRPKPRCLWCRAFARTIRRRSSVKLVAVVVALLFAVRPAIAADNADRAALEKLNADWFNAYRTNDVATVDRILADDFEGVYPGDRLLKKADVLKGMANPSGTVTNITWDKLDILVFGDVAMVRGVTRTTGTNAQGAAFNAAVDYADVFVKRNGTWRAVSAHVVRLPQ